MCVCPEGINSDSREITVGHMPRFMQGFMSQGFSLFLRQGENVFATIVSTRKYSRKIGDPLLSNRCLNPKN